MRDETEYIITKTCFVGEVGDRLKVDWWGMDGANWTNETKNTMGCPFIETDCVKKVEK